MKTSFKIVLACMCAAGSMNCFSQQSFRACAHGGISTIQYTSDDIAPKLMAPSSLGGGVSAEYIRYINSFLGVSAGLGFSMSQSKYELSGTLSENMAYYIPEVESEKSFVYNAKFENWEEKQMIHTIDIPVGAVGRLTLFDGFTVMAGAGVKIQLPIIATYKVADGATRSTSGYFKDANLEVTPDVLHHGFYTLRSEDGKWQTVEDKVTCDMDAETKGDLNTKSIAFSAYVDLGVAHKLFGQQFYYGVYGQYGFTPLNKEASAPFLSQYGAYDSPFNTKAIDKYRLLSFGIKIGYVLPIGGTEYTE